VIQPPDPDRIGGLAWTRRTRGELTAAERRRLIGEVVRTQAVYIAGRVKLLTGYSPPAAGQLSADDLRPPDSAFARAAEEACAEQPASVAGHGYRSWMFGSALAALDRVELEPEAFYAAALLHDYGIAQPVAGEDFTLRNPGGRFGLLHRCGLTLVVRLNPLRPR
jgi:hypothetical protein